MPIRLDEDMHVHSTFSDGKNSLSENLQEAERIGLRRLGCVDHVRRDTRWLPEFVEAVRAASKKSLVCAVAGVETKILNTDGLLDLPQDLRGVELIYAADHQFPLNGRCVKPAVIRGLIQEGHHSIEQLLSMLVRSTRRVLERYPNVVLAHLFSILPKVGLSENLVPTALIESLAQDAAEAGAMVEVDERWRCPSLRVLKIFHRAGVPILSSSDSHRKERIGRFQYNQRIAAALEKV